MKKNIAFMLLWATLMSTAIAQPTHVVTDPEKSFKAAKDYFIQQQYGLAYPLLTELHQQLNSNQSSNHTYLNDDIIYYYTVCRLKLQLPVAETEAQNYISEIKNAPRVQLMHYHLGRYYFTKEDFTHAIEQYETAGLDNLSNEEIANAKFEKAYSYFNLKRFDEAKPLFYEIHLLPENKYYIPANYYYGFIAYYNRQFNEALKCFRLVELMDDYKGVVPYYIAEIFYFQGQKDEALRYGETVLSRGQLFYEKEMKQLMGQIYFERKQFSKALPLLEYYVNNSTKVSREDLYELSYCYYDAQKLEKAIDGFKQLSNETDSLGQNSMYLLGDCYLRTNQKANARNAFQFCAYNSSNLKQQEVSRFNYAKLSYELSYQDIALTELKKFLNDYPNSVYLVEAKEIMVSLLSATNNFNDALTLYESISKPTPVMQKAYPKILYGRAVEYFNDQQLVKADELLNKIILLPASTVTPYAQFWKGEIAYRLPDYDNAIRYYTIFLQANVPAAGEANANAAKYNLGYCWLKKENFKQALSNFEAVGKQTVTASAMEQDAYIRSADCYFMQKEYAKAAAMYDVVINNALPQSDYALFQKAMVAGIKSAATKITLLSSLSRLYPKSVLVPEANVEIANTYMADEKFTEAIPYLNAILNSGNTVMKPRTLQKLGLCYYNLDKEKEALQYYQQLIQQYPQSAETNDILDNVKAIYVKQGKPEDYVELMRKNGLTVDAVEADQLTYQAAELKYNNGDCTGAIAAYSNYITRFPAGASIVAANFYRSECYYKLKDWNNALIGYTAVFEKGQNPYYERATLYAARIYYFELKQYAPAITYFNALRTNAQNQDVQLEALRGLVRCFYQVKDYQKANEGANELLLKKGISTDDKSIAFLVLGKSQQFNKDYTGAIASFKSAAAINKSAWGAEARYEIAASQFAVGNYAVVEKAALAVIKETGSYDLWVTKAYILIGDVLLQQKDYFNAKAAYQSVAQNAIIPELKTEAQQKLDAAIAAEAEQSKLK